MVNFLLISGGFLLISVGSDSGIEVVCEGGNAICISSGSEANEADNWHARADEEVDEEENGLGQPGRTDCSLVYPQFVRPGNQLCQSTIILCRGERQFP